MNRDYNNFCKETQLLLQGLTKENKLLNIDNLTEEERNETNVKLEELTNKCKELISKLQQDIIEKGEELYDL